HTEALRTMHSTDIPIHVHMHTDTHSHTHRHTPSLRGLLVLLTVFTTPTLSQTHYNASPRHIHSHIPRHTHTYLDTHTHTHTHTLTSRGKWMTSLGSCPDTFCSVQSKEDRKSVV